MLAILETLGWVLLPILLIVFASTELVVLINDAATPQESPDSIAQRASAAVRDHHAATLPPLPLQRTRTHSTTATTSASAHTDFTAPPRPRTGATRQRLLVS